MAYGVQPYDPSKPVVPKPASNPMVNSYGAPLQPPTNTVPKPALSPAPQPQQSWGTPSSGSTAVPAPSNYSGPGPSTTSTGNVPPVASRWNPDAAYQDRLTHFGGNGNDARSEILAVKDMYNKEMAGGASTDRLLQINDWARQVRDAAGIDQMDVLYGNGVDKTKQIDDGGQAPAEGGFAYQPSGQQVPAYNPAFKPYTDEQAKALAMQRWNEKYRDLGLSANDAIRRGETGATEQIGSLNTQLNRLKTQIGEQRGVDDVTNARRLSPFSGKSDFTLGMIERERAQGDRQLNEDQMSRVANINQGLADLKTSINEKYKAMGDAAPDEINKLYDSIRADEKQYDLLLHGTLRDDMIANSQLTNADFGRQLQSYQANQAAQGQQFSQGLQSKIANWGAYKDSVDMTGNLGSGPMSDWGNLGKTSGPPSYQSVQDALKNGMTQQQIDNSAKQAAAQLGYNYDNMNANDKQAWAQIAISQQNANTAAGTAKNTSAAREIESEVYNHAGEFQSAQDVTDYFNANSSYLAKNLGAKGVEDLKKSFMDSFNTDNKQANSNYLKALTMAQNDYRWKMPDANKQALIKEYEDLISSPN